MGFSVLIEVLNMRFRKKHAKKKPRVEAAA
jgi:hypothetical protein